jgi:hypothetical protein
MFDSIVAKVASIVRKAVHAVGTALHQTPWFAPVAILAFFLVVS